MHLRYDPLGAKTVMLSNNIVWNLCNLYEVWAKSSFPEFGK